MKKKLASASGAAPGAPLEKTPKKRRDASWAYSTETPETTHVPKHHASCALILIVFQQLDSLTYVNIAGKPVQSYAPCACGETA